MNLRLAETAMTSKLTPVGKEEFSGAKYHRTPP